MLNVCCLLVLHCAFGLVWFGLVWFGLVCCALPDCLNALWGVTNTSFQVAWEDPGPEGDGGDWGLGVHNVHQGPKTRSGGTGVGGESA